MVIGLLFTGNHYFDSHLDLHKLNPEKRIEGLILIYLQLYLNWRPSIYWEQ